MDLPQIDYDTPFNITRAGHVVLTIEDLVASRLLVSPQLRMRGFR